MTDTVERMFPLYEAKMLDAYDHRDADVYKSATAEKRQNQPRYLTDEDKADPWREALPINWVREEVLPGDLPAWLVGFSDITSATNERTMLSAALPRGGVGNSYALVMGEGKECLLGVFNSFAFDYIARLKVAGLHINFFYLKQLPMPSPETFDRPCSWGGDSLRSWMNERVAALSCTSWAMGSMAKDLVGRKKVYAWDPGKRFLIRCEIDAAVFHLFGIARDDVAYIMDTFRAVRKHDEAAHGEYQTKRIILGIYDAMQHAINSGVPYKPVVDLSSLVISSDESS